MDNSLITLSNTKIEKNDVGISSAEVLPPEIIENVKSNKLDMNNEAVAAASVLPPARPAATGIFFSPSTNTPSPIPVSSRNRTAAS